MSDLLSIAASGVRAYQTALNTIGDNIANSGVAGYSRRTVTLKEQVVGAGPTAGITAGVGVIATGIQRTGDTFATQALRNAGADLGKTTTTVSWLDRIGKALDGNSIAARMTDFFNTSDALAAEPASSALRATFLASAGNVGNALTATGIAFDQIDADIDGQATQAAQSLTSLGQALVRINDGLGRTRPDTTASAQLLDQRDQILDQMSAISDIKVSTDINGRATVLLGSGAGAPFVAVDRANIVRYDRDAASGDVAFSVQNGAGWLQLDPTGGAMAGFVEGAQRTNAARAGIEKIATDFTTAINDQHEAGFDLNGDQGQPLFVIGARPTDVALNPAVTYDKVAAAGGDGGTPQVSLGTRDASNLAQLSLVRESGQFENDVTHLVTGNAAILKQRTTIADAQQAIRQGAETAMSTATGVNLDSEAIDLMRFQQAYQASSRAIQVARDTIQTILDIR